MEDHTLTFDALSTLNDLPGCHLILLPDAPQFTIIAATTAYLQATFTERSSILGKGLFEVFPDNPTLAAATGVKNLSASLHWVLKHKKAHHMEDQRYDVRRPQTGDFEYKVWRPMNKPVLSGSGEIRYIIHTVEDITHQVHLQETGQQTQKALTNTSEALLHQKRLTDTILEASLNGIYVLEAVRDKEGKISDFRYLFANQAIADYLGLHVPQMIGNTVLELIPENKTNGFFGYFCQVLEKGAAARDQSYFTSKNFTGWFDFTIVPLDQ
ncbi:MAG TPA: PAS domain-containing protein, partial [Flavisolibacter sp.]|nr:PAS domain-containing protein [Flavisolibacter sp.]